MRQPHRQTPPHVAAANGLSLAANGGLTFGNGASAIAATTVNQDDLCLQQSGANRLSGSITYVQL